MEKSEHTQIITPSRLFLQEGVLNKEVELELKLSTGDPINTHMKADVFKSCSYIINQFLDGTINRDITLIKSYNCDGSEDSDDYVFRVVDGMDRLMVIKLFITNQISIVFRGEASFFENLPIETQKKLKHFRFNATLYTEFNDEKFTDAELIEIYNNSL